MDLLFIKCKKFVSADTYELFISRLGNNEQNNQSEYYKKNLDMFEGHLQTLIKNSVEYYLQSAENFIKLQTDDEKILSFDDNKRLKYTEFLKTMTKLSNICQETLSKFIELTKLHLDPESRDQADIFNTISRNIAKYNCGPIFIDALNYRKGWLTTKLKSIPDFTWCMPEACLEQNPVVQQFLRGPKSQLHKRFITKKTAKSFEKKHGDYLMKYLYDMDIIYESDIVKIKFIKNRTYFNDKIEKEFGDFKQDLKIIEACLNKLKNL